MLCFCRASFEPNLSLIGYQKFLNKLMALSQYWTKSLMTLDSVFKCFACFKMSLSHIVPSLGRCISLWLQLDTSESGSNQQELRNLGNRGWIQMTMTHPGSLCAWHLHNTYMHHISLRWERFGSPTSNHNPMENDIQIVYNFKESKISFYHIILKSYWVVRYYIHILHPWIHIIVIFYLTVNRYICPFYPYGFFPSLLRCPWHWVGQE